MKDIIIHLAFCLLVADAFIIAAFCRAAKRGNQ